MANVTLMRGSDADLALLDDATVDLVLACDVLPYIVACGEETVARVIGQAARVLRAGGHLAILNHAYRGTPERDLADVKRHGASVGLDAVIEGESAFDLWDGRAYVLVRPRW